MEHGLAEETTHGGPRGFLTFKAIRVEDEDRIRFTGEIPVWPLFEQGFVEPVESAGLSPEVVKIAVSNGPVQRKTNAAHVQAIVDYIVERAEQGEPWTFNSIVLYSTDEIEFEGQSLGFAAAGEARLTSSLSVGEGLHRCLAWAVSCGLAKVRGVKRPDVSELAEKRITRATIPVLVIEEGDLHRQRTDFNRLNQQKPLTSTVLNLTDDTALTDLTKMLIADVKLFEGRIDLNNASASARSDKLLAFAQLRFIVASYLLGHKTRSRKQIDSAVESLVEDRGIDSIRAELQEVFNQIASRFGGLERLHRGRVSSAESGDVIRTLRSETLLAAGAAWRALAVALHDAAEAGVSVEDAIDRVKHDSAIEWSRDADFFIGTLIDRDTGKLLSNRESIDAAADKLLGVMTRTGV